ncbi:hypothetical protein FE784_09690 [Paenibacillus hemerocallicola]|uniref:Uncharacterized protein n=1 Tax=Paenibacillus hemerocallicola TaxID=1172614 RepID=A0A5C4TBR9_9BACL|nr:hypothetical protein [Paenibacillus hemerocallicola]TNJ66528.1 hypothetical protein FE784_09690 [Paenibacillus hemerocallicola]
MGWLERQREMKLDILESLARSQRAMARIIESAADAGAGAGSVADGGASATEEPLRKSIEAIAQYQLAIMEKMIGIRIGEVNSSPPSAPWTNKALGVAPCYDAIDPEDGESTLA